MRIPESFIQDLIARADVAEVVGRYVPLKKAGANWQGLCPFHNEKSPSFTVSPTKQFYHCFGCGKSGNAVGFLMEHLGLSFVDAVKDLASQLGLKVPQEDLSPEEEAAQARRKAQQATLTEVLEKAAAAYQERLKSAERAINYLKKRGLSGEISKRYGLGYAPEGWQSLASVFPDYADRMLTDSGLVIERVDEQTQDTKRYDRFRDRVMFPIRNVKGECIGFGGRIIDQGEPKYLNSPETPVFSKGRELYGLWEARDAIRQANFALVTEGYMDVVALAQMGFENAVATLGTACTPDHIQKLTRYCPNVVFAFDGDKAGRRAARKALDIALPFASDVRTFKFLFLPEEHDPDSYIRAHGKDGFNDFVQAAKPLSEFFLDACTEGLDDQGFEGRSQIALRAKELWTALPEGGLKIQLRNELSERTRMSPRELTELWTHDPYARSYSSDTKGNRYSFDSKKRPEYADIQSKNHKKGRFNAFQPALRDASLDALTGYGGTRDAAPHLRKPARTRADRALQLACLDHSLLAELSPDQVQALCELPAPHGAAFRWLEAQWHEHGSQAWAALRIGADPTPHAHLLIDLMSRTQIDEALPTLADTEADQASQEKAQIELEKKRVDIHTGHRTELADILKRMQIDSLNERMQVAAQAGDLEMLRLLDAQFKALKLNKTET